MGMQLTFTIKYRKEYVYSYLLQLNAYEKQNIIVCKFNNSSEYKNAYPLILASNSLPKIGYSENITLLEKLLYFI